MMASREGGQHPDFQLETPDGPGYGLRDVTDEVDMCMFKDEHTRSDAPPSPNPDFNETTTARAYAVCKVDKKTNLQPLHSEPPCCSHVTVPDHFTRRKEDFKHFRCQFSPSSLPPTN
jgi:hypothetical protein